MIGANALFQDNLPIHKEIADAAKKAGIEISARRQMTEGWIAGMVIEAALKGAGWPADAAKVAAAMENLKVDTKGLRGGPIEWTKDNHFRTKQYYRVYQLGRRRRSRVVKDWIDLRREVTGFAVVARARSRGGGRRLRPTESRRAARRQHHRAGGDLRADRLRLCADLSRQPRAQSGAWRADDARRLSAAGDGVAVQRPSVHGASAPRSCLSLVVGVLVYVFLMRKMTGEMVLAAVLTTVALGILLRGLMVLIWSAQQQYPGAGARRLQSRAGAARRRAHLAVVGGPRR